jgi:apolipoprotein N-acyltransferase
MSVTERELRARSRARWRRFTLDRTSLAAAALGALTVAGYAPLYLYPLPIATLAVLTWLWNRAESARRAAEIGWWFGLGFFLTGVSWVYVSLHNFGAMPAPLAALATLLFCAYLAIFPAAVGYAYARLGASPAIKLLLWLPALWALSEWIRGWLFTGFPWLATGYSQIPLSPLAGYAPALGIFGVTLVTVACAGCIVLLAERVRAQHGRKTEVAAHGLKSAAVAAVAHPALIVLVLLAAGGYALKQVTWTRPAGEPFETALLQGNIPQDIKWTEQGLRATLVTYRRLALATDAKLIVFPETALPLFLHQVPKDYFDALAGHARKTRGDILVGIPERLPSGDYYNSAIAIGTSPTQVYRKTHLVPFGEFIPLRPVLGWIVSVLAIPLQDFSRGPEHARPLEIAGQRVAVNICYEDAFGEEIIRQLPEATVLVNVSNVAWFGRSIAPRQHLQISQARALETGRYMLRATNTGMTGIIDDRGNVLQVAPQFETAVVTGPIQGYTGATPYVRWGNLAVLALAAAMVVAALSLTYRQRRYDSRR